MELLIDIFEYVYDISMMKRWHQVSKVGTQRMSEHIREHMYVHDS
jgi:hypothetical protein